MCCLPFRIRTVRPSRSQTHRIVLAIRDILLVRCPDKALAGTSDQCEEGTTRPMPHRNCRISTHPTPIHSCSFTEIVTDGLCSHQWIAYVFHNSSCSMAVMSVRVTAASGDCIANENTVVVSGFVTSASLYTPCSLRNCVRGSLLSARTVRM